VTSTRSEDEVLTAYLSSMGDELGNSAFLLFKKLVELHIIWQQYRQLYGSDPEVIHLLNRTAGLFFKIVQDELWDSVLLGISRLTDPPATGKKKNLTIQSLPPLIGDPKFRAELQSLCDFAVLKTEFARDHRNKRIAHQDHGYTTDRSLNPLTGVSRECVEAMLSSLRQVMNHLDGHFRDSTVMYERFVDQSGARVLISKLKQLERAQNPEGAL